MEKDEILVNDDDHEDLVRVVKLMGYLGFGNNYDKNTSQHNDKKEELGLEDLYKPLNKKQIVRSIPYYFKNQQSPMKDYRVYYYDEI